VRELFRGLPCVEIGLGPCFVRLVLLAGRASDGPVPTVESRAVYRNAYDERYARDWSVAGASG